MHMKHVCQLMKNRDLFICTFTDLIILLFFVFAIVIGSELFNTSIETIVDMVMPEKNEKAKIAKDVSAGAVLVVAIGAAIIGLVIFVPRILNILI